ncbi:MAG: hypothetical protein QOK37_2473 [Thermoanaerobaculia bacterium]|jgi:hypothetical protein|nr:hypothetical protein [Thermoanaerobaculia bacterium]
MTVKICGDLARDLTRFNARTTRNVLPRHYFAKLRLRRAAWISDAPMNNIEFIQEREEESCPLPGTLTGWETVVFQLEDVPPEE